MAKAAPSKPARQTWLTGYGEEWRARWGEDSEPPWGEMAKHLRQPHEKHGGDALRGWWAAFLAAAERAEWARPARFVQGLGQWSGTAARASPRSPPGKGTVGTRTLAAAEEFLKGGKKGR